MSKSLWLAGLVTLQVFVTASSAHAGFAIVPEPTTLTLLGVGAGVVAVAGWWRHRK